MARLTLDANPKFKTLVYRLQLPRPYVRGLLETLWDVANACGEPVIGDPYEVEAAAEWPGEPSLFFASLRDCRLIDPVDGERWEIHDYWDHAPDYVRKRRIREQARRVKGKSLKADRTTADNGGQRRPLTNTRAPAPTRIQIEPSLRSGSCVEPEPPASALEPVIAFPIVGGEEEEWGLAPDKLAEYEQTYPTAPEGSVLAELRKARQWCRDNPARRKTARGMPSFLAGWLSRAQNRGGIGSTATGGGNGAGTLTTTHRTTHGAGGTDALTEEGRRIDELARDLIQ